MIAKNSLGMKRLASVLLISLIVGHFIAAQQIVLQGQVSIHNSKYHTGVIEYVDNAYVSAPFTTPDDTDAEGFFYLEFVGLSEGTSMRLNVEKAGLEVVNQKDLEDVVIGRKTPLKVYLAKKGQLAKAQTELYNVSLKALTKRHDQTIARLRATEKERQAAIKELEQKLNRQLANRFEAEQILNEQLEATKKRLPEFARELATVNLDFASQMYQKAYEYFKAGEIEKAIETLDEAVLDKEAKDVVGALDSLNSNMDRLEDAILIEEKRVEQLIENLLLNAKLQAQKSQYAEALTHYERAISLLEKKEKKERRLATAYWEAGAIHQRSDAKEEALDYKRKTARLYETIPEVDASVLAETYQDIAALFLADNEMDSTIIYKQKAFDLKKSRLPADDPVLQTEANHLMELLEQRGRQLLQQRKYKEAVLCYQKVLTFTPEKKRAKEIKRIIKRLNRDL